MTKPHRIARNAVVNLAGQIAPMAAALVSIPLLIHGLGQARYSLLLLAWALVGYFGFVDLGLGRALTHAVASRLGVLSTTESWADRPGALAAVR